MFPFLCPSRHTACHAFVSRVDRRPVDTRSGSVGPSAVGLSDCRPSDCRPSDCRLSDCPTVRLSDRRLSDCPTVDRRPSDCRLSNCRPSLSTIAVDHRSFSSKLHSSIKNINGFKTYIQLYTVRNDEHNRLAIDPPTTKTVPMPRTQTIAMPRTATTSENPSPNREGGIRERVKEEERGFGACGVFVSNPGV
jgi:hypothetical protein